ncbi:helix-turn-helix transcriptional regulator [Enterococcus cecorum]|nr:helix-turn-helix transcriptional regulator [Enterococcus cecorum]
MTEETISNPETLNVMTCRVEDSLEVLSGKWKLKILMQIFKNLNNSYILP